MSVDTSSREAVILGTVLEMNGEELPPTIAKLLEHAPDSFDDIRHGATAVVIRQQRAKGQHATRISLIEKLSFEGAALFVSNLPDESLAMAEADAGQVWESYRQRKIKSVFGEAQNAMEADPRQADSIVATCINSLGTLTLDSSEPDAEAKAIGDLILRASGDDPDEILKHRLLCRGAGMLWVGPTGVGKSTSVFQAAFLWALCREAFGISPSRPLRTVIFQAENDDGDMAEFRDGIAHGLELSEDERKICFENIFVVTEFRRTGREFCDQVIAPQIRKHKPDLIIIDPALAYIGGDSLTQKDVGVFLRNYLNPVIKEGNCAVIVVHHTNKPATGEKSQWANGDFAYLGSGSAEWANWARAVLAIQTTGARGLFKLHAAKRGGRIGWKSADGATVYERLIAHTTEPGRIYWRDADEDELPTKGRPKNESSRSKVLGLLPESGLTNSKWEKLAKNKHSVARSTYRDIRDELEKSGAVIESINGRWMPCGENGGKWRKVTSRHVAKNTPFRGISAATVSDGPSGEK